MTIATAKKPSAQTQREIREIGLPIEAIRSLHVASKSLTTRLRGDTIKMADDRVVGRHRGENSRLRTNARRSKKRFEPISEIDWIDKCKTLGGTFHYSHKVQLQRGAHMVNYASNEAYQLIGESFSLEWFIRGWELRINHRNRLTDQRIVVGFGRLKEEDVDEMVIFRKVTVDEYTVWVEANPEYYA